MQNQQTAEPATASATLRCKEDDCIEIEYRAKHLDPDTDAREFLNEMGPPMGLTNPDGTARCPGCDGSVTVDWGDDDDDR